MKISSRVIQTQVAFADLQDVWRELMARGGNGNIFSSWEWLYTWWSVYRERLRGGELFILEVSADNRVIAIVPAYRTTGIFGRRQLQLLGDRFETSLYVDFLIDPAFLSEAIAEITSAMRRTGIWLLEFRNVLEDSYCAGLAQHGFAVVRPEGHCPYITLPTSFDAYLTTRRRNVQKDRKRLFEAEGAMIRDLAICGREALETLFHLHEAGFADRGKATRFLKEARMMFHDQLLSRLESGGMVYLLGIEHQGRIVAASYGFRYGTQTVGYQMGYESEYRRYAIGFQLVLNEVEWAIAHGAIEHDLSIGTGAHKDAFATGVRQVVSIRSALHPFSRQYLKLFEWCRQQYNRIRPLTRLRSKS